jgi:hypothetical protein
MSKLSPLQQSFSSSSHQNVALVANLRIVLTALSIQSWAEIPHLLHPYKSPVENYWLPSECASLPLEYPFLTRMGMAPARLCSAADFRVCPHLLVHDVSDSTQIVDFIACIGACDRSCCAPGHYKYPQTPPAFSYGVLSLFRPPSALYLTRITVN